MVKLHEASYVFNLKRYLIRQLKLDIYMRDGSVGPGKFITRKWMDACSTCKCSKTYTDLPFRASYDFI